MGGKWGVEVLVVNFQRNIFVNYYLTFCHDHATFRWYYCTFAMSVTHMWNGTNLRACLCNIAPFQDQEMPLSGPRSAQITFYHAKLNIFVKYYPFSWLLYLCSACKNTTFTRFVLLALAYQCPHISDPPVVPAINYSHVGWTSEKQKYILTYITYTSSATAYLAWWIH